jgi:CMP-N,N'-diacetyllegionaminic acid synthase
MTATAVILARRGSKGVPGKNMTLVAGRPCLAWSIEAALSSRGVSRVVVSTDWPQAAALARDMGVEAIERPAELASDTASVDAAARHAIASLHAPAGPVVTLYANVPVRPSDLIERAVDLLDSTHADSVQSYVPVGKHHPWWTCRLNPNTAEVGPWEGEKLFHGTYRRQDLPPAFIPDGGVLAVSHRALFLEIEGVPAGPHAFLGREQNRRGVVTREGDVIDIDSPIDLVVADAVLRSRPRRASTPWSLHPVATGTFT